MHSKVVLVVSRTHWRCLACKVFNRRAESIDQHLQTAHHEADESLAVRDATSQLWPWGLSSLSDSEIDVPLPQCMKSTAFNEKSSSSSSSSGPQKGKLSEDGYLTVLFNSAKSVTEELTERCGLRKSAGKPNRRQRQVKKVKSPKVGMNAKNCDMASEKSRSDNPYLPDEVKTAIDEIKAKRKEVTTPDNVLRSKSTRIITRASQREKSGSVLSAAEQSTKNIKQKKSSQRTGKRKTRLSRETHIKNVSLAPGATNLGVSDKKTRNPLKLEPKASKTTRDKGKATGTPAIDEQFYDSDTLIVDLEAPHSDDDFPVAKMERTVNNPAQRKRPVSCQAPIDKSNIATGCVPWLLESGRKAGQKVTKKPRRPLLPEEKLAVRGLYLVPKLELLQQNPATVSERGLHSSMASKHPSVAGETFEAGHLSGTTTSSQRTFDAGEDGIVSAASHREYVVTAASFTPDGPCRNFRAENSQAQGSRHESYSDVHLLQQSQQRCYPSQSQSEFYSASEANIPPLQKANWADNRTYDGQTGALVSLSTASVGADNVPRLADSIGTFPGPDLVLADRPHQRGIPAQIENSKASPVPINASTAPADNYVIDDSLTRVGYPGRPTDTPLVAREAYSENRCRVCEQQFQSPELIEKHVKEFSGFEPFQCKRCRSKFHGLYELNVHVFSVHETEKQCFCFLCDEGLVGMESLEKHVYRHSTPPSASSRELAPPPRETKLRFHDCRLCRAELQNSYGELRTHYYQHHVALVCRACLQAFTDVESYTEHCGSAHPGSPPHCGVCGQGFPSAGALRGHLPCSQDLWAEDGQGGQCAKCGQWCPNRAVVEAHRRQHRSQEDVEAYREGARKGFPCVTCEKVFKNKHACRRHVKMVHEGVSCYTHHCEHCGKGFLTKGHMRDHVAVHHLHIRRYRCDYCDRQFVCGPTLRRHVRKEHTKQRPYACQHCGERFFEKIALVRHLTVHTGLAPFMCEHCGKGFYTKHNFNNHASTHSAVKDFVCLGCRKGFTRKYNLQAHAKICKML